jgi:hypothetical protein
MSLESEKLRRSLSRLISRRIHTVIVSDGARFFAHPFFCRVGRNAPPGIGLDLEPGEACCAVTEREAMQ